MSHGNFVFADTIILWITIYFSLTCEHNDVISTVIGVESPGSWMVTMDTLFLSVNKLDFVISLARANIFSLPAHGGLLKLTADDFDLSEITDHLEICLYTTI